MSLRDVEYRDNQPPEPECRAPGPLLPERLKHLHGSARKSAAKLKGMTAMHTMTIQIAAGAISTAHSLLQALRCWWLERRTTAELHSLDDAALKNIGISWCQIPSIARRYCTEFGSM